MSDYRSIAIELNRTFKDKVIERLTGIPADTLCKIRAGRRERPQDPDACVKLRELHQLAKEDGWI